MRACSSVPASTWTAGTDPEITPRLATAALLLIDTQVDFTDDGAVPLPGTATVLPALARLRAGFRAAGRPIVHVVRLYQGEDVDRVRRAAIAAGAAIVAPDTPGAEVVAPLRTGWRRVPAASRLLAGEPVEVADEEMVLWKPRWSAFHRTGLHALLTARGIDTVVVAGFNFPNCPRATVYDASARDYRVLLVTDATSGAHAHGVTELAGLGVLHAPTATVLSRLPGGHGRE